MNRELLLAESKALTEALKYHGEKKKEAHEKRIVRSYAYVENIKKLMNTEVWATRYHVNDEDTVRDTPPTQVKINAIDNPDKVLKNSRKEDNDWAQMWKDKRVGTRNADFLQSVTQVKGKSGNYTKKTFSKFMTAHTEIYVYETEEDAIAAYYAERAEYFAKRASIANSELLELCNELEFIEEHI